MYCGCEQPQARTISVLVVYFASAKHDLLVFVMLLRS